MVLKRVNHLYSLSSSTKPERMSDAVYVVGNYITWFIQAIHKWIETLIDEKYSIKWVPPAKIGNSRNGYPPVLHNVQ